MKDRSWARRTVEASPWLALLGLAVWAGHPSLTALVLTALTAAAALWLDGRGWTLRSFGLVVILATAAGGLMHLDRRQDIREDWSAHWAREEERITRDFQSALDPVFEEGPATASRLADLAASGNGLTYDDLARIRRRSGFHAAALFDADGRLQLWDGDHRGRVPDAVALGEADFLYRNLPLAGLLYVTAPVRHGGTAMVATLVRTDLPDRVRRASDDLLTRIQDRVNAELRILTPDQPAGADGVYDLTVEGQPLFSIVVEPVTEADRLRHLDRLARLWGLAGALLAWLLLALSPGRRQPGWAAAGALLLGLLLPFDDLAPAAAVADPASFLLLDLTLARWLALGMGLAVATGLLEPRRRIPWWAGTGVLAAVYVGAGAFWVRSVSADFLAGPEGGWIALVIALALLLAVVTWIVLRWTRTQPPAGGSGRVAAGWLAALAAAAVTAVLAGVQPGISPWVLLVWVLPVAVWGAPGIRALQANTALAWLAAGVLASGAALPLLWGERIEARIDLARAQVERLGVREDPFLEFLLARLANSVDSLAAQGVRPVELLYGGWKSSGLADAYYPIWLTLWTEGGLPREHLPIGMGNVELSRQVYEYNRGDAGEGMRIYRFDAADAHYLVQVPLADGRVVTGVVPPLQEVGGELLLGPLFGSLEEEQASPVRLVPLAPGDPPAPDSLVWTRRGESWRGELSLAYPEETYLAYFQVALPGPGVALARATLLLGLVLGLAVLAWVAGRAVKGVPVPVIRERLALLGSFRARVTLALFSFFTASVLIFGTLAYRTITGASERAAQVLAERVVTDASSSWLQVAGQIELLARRVGSDLLQYGPVGLEEGSLEPLVELGLYEGWVPYPVHRALTEREATLVTTPTVLGDWAYVTAYQRLPDGSFLGAPVPLETGATAVRSREIVHLLAFAVLAGIGISIFLAVGVGRALARPIQALRVASERVGSGNLRIRLPGERTDEFGTVFQAFNRMVKRLRRARRTLIRNTRRTRAIVEDAATGVVALDARGMVTLANARARTLLDARIDEGQPLDRAGGAAPEILEWIRRMLRDGLDEAGTEIQVGDRRMRAQARRITQEESDEAGVVLSLEDVTDELRSERILAWGEMARQVAHEVKNPLTPMKLSVQHLRRAWQDQRVDFGEILDRNAEAILGEIDRLAAIASGFSRFGAPEAAAQPLEPVALGPVVSDTLALYRSGDGPVRFVDRVAPGLPPVRARGTEVKEVLLNLLENSRAAIDGRGQVTVEALQEDGSAVLLLVRDDGSGIDPDLLPRIFEPHFSTRSAGTGLGLAIVKRVVESWGAAITVDSTPGRGTVARIRFPLPGGEPGVELR